jgi:hypothetical protein
MEGGQLACNKIHNQMPKYPLEADDGEFLTLFWESTKTQQNIFNLIITMSFLLVSSNWPEN